MKKFILLSLFMIGMASSSFAYTYSISKSGTGTVYKSYSCTSTSVQIYLETRTTGNGIAYAECQFLSYGHTKSIQSYGDDSDTYSGILTADSPKVVIIIAEANARTGSAYARTQVSW